MRIRSLGTSWGHLGLSASSESPDKFGWVSFGSRISYVLFNLQFISWFSNLLSLLFGGAGYLWNFVSRRGTWFTLSWKILGRFLLSLDTEQVNLSWKTLGRLLISLDTEQVNPSWKTLGRLLLSLDTELVILRWKTLGRLCSAERHWVRLECIIR